MDMWLYHDLDLFIWVQYRILRRCVVDKAIRMLSLQNYHNTINMP